MITVHNNWATHTESLRLKTHLSHQHIARSSLRYNNLRHVAHDLDVTDIIVNKAPLQN